MDIGTIDFDYNFRVNMVTETMNLLTGYKQVMNRCKEFKSILNKAPSHVRIRITIPVSDLLSA